MKPFLASLALLLLAVAAPAAVPPPNVLFLFSDDQRAGTIHALGNPDLVTPHLDRLAADGVACTRAYIMGGLQGAVCVPSRAMLLTSRSLFRIQESMTNQATWPEQFTRAGYRTFMTGKWHNDEASARRIFSEGRNVFFGGMSAAYQMPVSDFAAGKETRHRHLSPRHHTELFAETAIEFLRAQTNGQPFLCYVSFKSPHDPHTATPAWHAYYREHLPPLPANFLPQHPFDNGEMIVRDETLLPWPRTAEAVRQRLADYYACISQLDEEIGRILATLRATGLASNTLIAFAGDNGLAVGNHGLLGKQNLYEHAVAVPLLLSGPGLPRGLRNAEFCYLQDVFPTLAELAGVPPLAGMDGRSLLPLFRGDSAGRRDAIFTAYRSFQRAVRDERWKLIRYPQVDVTQLFDLQNDPFETNSLAGQPQYAGQVQRLTALLEREQKAFGDTLPLTVPQPKPAAWTPPPPAPAR